MNKYQKRWDQLLMVGWEEDKTIGWCVHKINENKDGLDVIVKKLSESGVKRCFDCGGRIPMQMPIRAFVSRSCRELSDKLFDGSYSLLFAGRLNEYKWLKLRYSDKAQRKKRRFNEMRDANAWKLLEDKGKYSSSGKYEWSTVR